MDGLYASWFLLFHRRSAHWFYFFSVLLASQPGELIDSFSWDLSPMSIVSPYSATSYRSVSSWRLIDISVVAFVRTLLFSDNVSDIQWYRHAESVFRWTTVAFYCNTRLMSLNIASSSAKLMCLFSLPDTANMHAQPNIHYFLQRYW